MAITTSAGNAVKFLTLNPTISANILSALIGYRTSANANNVRYLPEHFGGSTTPAFQNNCRFSAVVNSAVTSTTETQDNTVITKNTTIVYLGISRTDPFVKGITEPMILSGGSVVADPDYYRVPLCKSVVQQMRTGTSASYNYGYSYDFSSEYLNSAAPVSTDTGVIDGETVTTMAKIVNSEREIKFHRSMAAWVHSEGGSTVSSSFPYVFFSTSPTLTTPASILASGELVTPITVNNADIVPLFAEDQFKLMLPIGAAIEDIVDDEATTP